MISLWAEQCLKSKCFTTCELFHIDELSVDSFFSMKIWSESLHEHDLWYASSGILSQYSTKPNRICKFKCPVYIKWEPSFSVKSDSSSVQQFKFHEKLHMFRIWKFTGYTAQRQQLLLLLALTLGLMALAKTNVIWQVNPELKKKVVVWGGGSRLPGNIDLYKSLRLLNTVLCALVWKTAFQRLLKIGSVDSWT